VHQPKGYHAGPPWTLGAHCSPPAALARPDAGPDAQRSLQARADTSLASPDRLCTRGGWRSMPPERSQGCGTICAPRPGRSAHLCPAARMPPTGREQGVVAGMPAAEVRWSNDREQRAKGERADGWQVERGSAGDHLCESSLPEKAVIQYPTRAARFKRLLGAGTRRSSIARRDYPWNTRATSCPCCPAVRCSTSCCRPEGPAVSSSPKLSAHVDVDLDSRLQVVPHGTRVQTRAGADPNPNATRL